MQHRKSPFSDMCDRTFEDNSPDGITLFPPWHISRRSKILHRTISRNGQHSVVRQTVCHIVLIALCGNVVFRSLLCIDCIKCSILINLLCDIGVPSHKPVVVSLHFRDLCLRHTQIFLTFDLFDDTVIIIIKRNGIIRFSI